VIHETARLILRPWQDRDRDPFAAIVSDPEVMRFYPAVRPRPEADAWIDRMIARYADGTGNFLAVERKSDGALMGLLGTADTTFPIPTAPKLEIGWVLGKQFWGQGYAPEGARVMLAHAFDVLHAPDVVAFTSALNTPSQRVMAKIGMVRDPNADFDNPNVPEGSPLRPHVLYRITRLDRP
jgi:RimJ/RimL family protein N-acetyltransferase